MGRKIVADGASGCVKEREKQNLPFSAGPSYYWVIGRSPIGVRTLSEKFAVLDQIGYLAYEFLDGKLVRSEAVKVIRINTP